MNLRFVLIFSLFFLTGTLQSFLNGKQSTGAEALSFDFNTIKNILKGILSGLAFMHGKGYIHRDIKGMYFSFLDIYLLFTLYQKI